MMLFGNCIVVTGNHRRHGIFRDDGCAAIDVVDEVLLVDGIADIPTQILVRRVAVFGN